LVRGFGGRLAAVAVLALAIRLAYTLVVGADIPTIGDARTYHRLAANLAEGHGYIRPDDFAADGAETPTAEFPPLFPASLAVANLFGAETILAQKLVMCFVGVATVALIGVLGRLIAGPTVGLVAASIGAVYPMMFWSDGALMSETLYTALVAASLVLAWRARAQESLGRWLALGLTIGAAALTRSEALLLGMLLFVPLAMGVRSLPATRRVARAGVALAGVALLLAPWMLRNAIALDHFVPLSNNFGGLVIGANCPATYHGYQKGLWRVSPCHERVDVTGLDETERSREYLETGIDYARDHAADVPGVVTVRLLRTWGVYDVDGQIAWETFEGRDRDWQTAGHRMYLGLLSLAVVGVVIARRRGIWQWPLLVTPVVVCLVAASAYGNQRFRATAEPAIVVLAAVTLVAAVQRFGPRRWRDARADEAETAVAR